MKNNKQHLQLNQKSAAQLAKDELQQNKLDYFLLSQQVNTLCSQVDEIELE